MGLDNVLSTAVSGLRANALDVSVTANNVANVSTPGFVPDRVERSTVVTGPSPSTGSTAGGGVTTSIRPGLPHLGVSLEQSNADLASEFVRLSQAKAAYAQSLDLISSTEQMLKHRVDETA